MTDHTEAIESVLRQFKIDGHVDNVTYGPSVVRYEVKIGRGVRVESVGRLQKNFAYSTASDSIRLVAPIPGKAAVGIELPRLDREIVRLGDLPRGNGLSIPIGKSVEGEAVCADLSQMPHLLIAGATGSGKSSFINSMLVSLLGAKPGEVELTLIDCKQIELTPYDGVAHLREPVITEVDVAITTLVALVEEMETRYGLLRAAGSRDFCGLSLPRVVLVIDELADLIMQAHEVEPLIVRLLQKGRAAGIHAVLATQRPSVDVITGLIKSNAPSRLAFATASAVDARVILDESGAEQLLGMGDGLWHMVGTRGAVRIQGAYVSDEEIAAAVSAATPDVTRVEATAKVEEMVHKLQQDPASAVYVPPPDVPSVLDIINEMIKRAERDRNENARYLQDLLKPRKWYGGKDGKMDALAQAPQKLGRSTDTLAYLARTLKVIRDNALEEECSN